MSAHKTIEIAGHFQGPAGSGQGGYSAARTAADMTGTLKADFHKRIPLSTALDVQMTTPTTRELRNGDEIILRVSQVDAEVPTPPAVDIETAARGKAAYPEAGRSALRECYSCGVGEGSLAVWAGPIGDGTYFATTWAPPEWTAPSGTVAPEHIWATIDCPAGAKTCFDGPEPRVALTGTMTTELLAPVAPSVDHVIVAWADDWRGRRRRSGAALFAENGELLARQVSMWIATG